MTSLWRHSRLTYYDLGPNFLTQGVELLAGEVWQVSKRNSQYFRSYLRKTTGGPFGPPSGARVNGRNTENLVFLGAKGRARPPPGPSPWVHPCLHMFYFVYMFYLCTYIHVIPCLIGQSLKAVLKVLPRSCCYSGSRRVTILVHAAVQLSLNLCHGVLTHLESLF